MGGGVDGGSGWSRWGSSVGGVDGGSGWSR